jgi:DNA repair protein RadA/Sms
MEVINPSAIFLESLNPETEGAIVIATMEGTRPILLEIQALVTPTNTGFPRRTAVGVDLNRLNMIIAVMEKKMGLPLVNFDVYINVVGGMKLEGTFADLGISAAIYSSLKGISIATREIIMVGEISLTADLRPVSHIDRMVKEAEKLGFKKIVLPRRNSSKSDDSGNIKVVSVNNLYEALRLIV